MEDSSKTTKQQGLPDRIRRPRWTTYSERRQSFGENTKKNAKQKKNNDTRGKNFAASTTREEERYNQTFAEKRNCGKTTEKDSLTNNPTTRHMRIMSRTEIWGDKKNTE